MLLSTSNKAAEYNLKLVTKTVKLVKFTLSTAEYLYFARDFKFFSEISCRYHSIILKVFQKEPPNLLTNATKSIVLRKKCRGIKLKTAR